MKTIEEIIKQTPIYLNDWENKEDVARDFDNEDILKLNILIASYTYKDWESSAFVLVEIDKKLYEVNGSHCSCSCFGLENQWDLEEVNLVEMQNRLVKGTFGSYEYKEQLKEFLGIDI